jgi:hypothetical protein
MTPGSGKRADGGHDKDGKPARGGRRGRGKREPAPPQSLEEKVDGIYERLISRRGAELLGMLDIISSRKRLMWLNFNAGLARGVGFFLGVTMIGALILGGVALAFNFAAHSLGYTDITLEQAVSSTVRKFTEIRQLVDDAQDEAERETQSAKVRAVGTEPEPGTPRLELPGAKPKRLGK